MRSAAKWKIHGVVVLAAAVLPIPVIARQSDAGVSAHLAAARRVVHIEDAGSRTITVDGNLAEWQPFTRSAGCILQGLNDSPSLPKISGRDAAMFKLIRGQDALYVAVRVVDSSRAVADPYYNGDAVQLFLDVRPLSGRPPLMGDSQYSAGALHLTIQAPSAGSTALRYQVDPLPGAPSGPVEAAGRLLPDGYTVELKLPYTTLGVPASRLNSPVGFDIFVDDLDKGDHGAVGERTEYAWAGHGDTWQDAALMGIATPAPVPALAAPYVELVPASYVQGAGYRGIVAGAAAMRSASPSALRIGLNVASAPGGADALAYVSTEVTDYPQLGIKVARKQEQFQSLHHAKYAVDTHFGAASPLAFQTSFDSLSWTRARTTQADRAQIVANMPATAAAGALLPSGWHVTPVGSIAALPGDMPARILVSPDGRSLIVGTAGYHDQSLTVYDAVTLQKRQSLPVANTWTGMCMDARTGTVYLPGAERTPHKTAAGTKYDAAIQRYQWNGTALSPLAPLSLPAGSAGAAFIGALATGASDTLYGLDINGDTVFRMSTATGAVLASARVGYRPGALQISPNGRDLAVANWGDRSVSLLDPRTLRLKVRIPVGSHPGDLQYGPDGRLYVACAGSDDVSIINGRTVQETVKTSITPVAPLGCSPVALAISPAGRTLYVANAGSNNVAVVGVGTPGAARVLGFIPTGWYPCAATVSGDGSHLFIGTGKGLTFSGNPSGAYIGTLLHGDLASVHVPSQQTLLAYTRRVVRNTPAGALGRSAPAADSVASSGAFGKIKHVLYIIRENRTYDQVFGDIAKGNGDPSLTMFGREVTPNAHALADRYVLLDNLYCSGEVSEDGHQWCDAAYATDFTEKAWVNSYSSRGEPAADDRLTASPAGYLWDNCARHHKTYYSYGEFSDFTASPGHPPVFNGYRSLAGHASADWSIPSFDNHDTVRAAVFLRDLKQAEQSNRWPDFIVMSLGEDHTQGTAPGKYTPVAHVAGNDQALAQIVEGVTHSRFWPETAIFVIEDDAQDGSDHVDAHRTVGLVISPWARRGVVDHSFYTTASMVRTVEDILGLPPMTQFDAGAAPMKSVFAAAPDLLAYTPLPPQVDIEARNPRNARAALAAKGLDFAHYDRIPPAIMNRMIWQSVRPGQVPPPPVHAALFTMLLQPAADVVK